jgi:hypothetical protein
MNLHPLMLATEPVQRMQLAPPSDFASLDAKGCRKQLRFEAAEKALELVLGGRPGSHEASAALVAARRAWTIARRAFDTRRGAS